MCLKRRRKSGRFSGSWFVFPNVSILKSEAHVCVVLFGRDVMLGEIFVRFVEVPGNVGVQLSPLQKKKREKKVNKSYATQYSRRGTQPLATELLTTMLRAVRVMPFEEESARGLAEERLSSCFYVRTLRMWYPFSRVSLFHRRRVVIVCFWL